MISYSLEKCNIKGCDSNQYDLLLCKKHYTKYIFDVKSTKIQSLVHRIATRKLKLIDKLKIILNTILHYIFITRVYYVEHFPLESIFLYNFWKNKKNSNSDKEKSDFIDDFDYENNYYAGHIKSSICNQKYNQDLIEDSKDDGIKLTFYVYLTVLILLILTYFYINLFSNIYIPEYGHYLEIISILFLLTPIIFLGGKYILAIKEVIKLAYKNNLYQSETDNLKFLENCRSIIYRIKRNNERKLTFFGGSIALATIYFFHEYPIVEYCGLNVKIFFTITNILIFILFAIILNISWNNFYLIHFIRRFENSTFKIDLYDLDRNLGLKEIKSLFRFILVFNLVLLISFYSLITDSILDNPLILFCLCFFFIGGNISSLIFLPRLYYWLRNQFNELVKIEKENIEKLPFVEKYQKFEFLKDLKLNLLYDWNFKLKQLLFLVPLFIKIIIEKYQDPMLNWIKTLIK